MANPSAQHSPRRTLMQRLWWFLWRGILTILIILVLVVLLLQTPYVQNIIRGQAEKYLSRKLHTRLRIGQFYFRFPRTVLLRDIYVEDHQQDTLLAAGMLRVDMQMWALLHNKVEVHALQLDDITVKVSRKAGDSAYNFQFIPDAFAGGEKAPKPDTSASTLKLALEILSLDKIRLVYSDSLTGDRATVWLGHSWVRHFGYDPQAADPLQVEQVGLVRSQLEYGNAAGGLNTRLDLGRLITGIRKLDLDHQLVEVGDLQLDSSDVAVRMGKVEGVAGKPGAAKGGEKIAGKGGAKSAGKKDAGKAGAKGEGTAKASSGAQAGSAPGWRVLAGQILLKDDKIRYDDDTQKKQKRGMDYAHLKIDGLQLEANKFYYSGDTISGNLAKGQMTEQSGLDLRQLKADFLYSGKGAWIKNLELRTPGTWLRRSAVMRWTSPEGIMKDPAHTYLDLDLTGSKVQVKDILLFAPFLASQPVFSKPGTVWSVDARMKGSLAALEVQNFQFTGMGNIRVALSGMLRNLTDPKRIGGQLNIRELSGTNRDIESMVPPGMLPASIALPAGFRVQGSAGGSMNDLNANLVLQSTAGMVKLKGMISQLRSSRNAQYDADIQTQALDLGFLLRDTVNFGKLTAAVKVKGKGMDVRTADAGFSGEIQSALLRHYEYNNLSFQGQLKEGQGTLSSSMTDTAIRFSLQASADLTRKFPGVRLDWQIDTLNLYALHLMADSMTFAGKLHADFASTDPDSLRGRLSLDQLRWHTGGKTLYTDSIVLVAEGGEQGEAIRLRSEMADLDWTGKYRLTELSQALEQTINHYYHIPGFRDTAFTPQQWKLDLALRPSPMVLAWMPSLKGTDTVGLHLSFDSQEQGLQANMLAPKIQYGKMIFHGGELGVATRGDQLQYSIGMAGMNGSGFQLHRVSLNGNLSHDQLHAGLLLKDGKEKDWYRLVGLLSGKGAGWNFVLHPDSLLLNYEQWTVSRDNAVDYDSAGLVVHDLSIGHGDEYLRIANEEPVASSPIDAHFGHFRISTLTRFAGQDSLLADGLMDGDVKVRDVLTNPVFTSDLLIKNLSYLQDSLGDLTLKVSNEKANAFSADIALLGHQNDVRVKGDYYTGEGKMDLNLDLGQLNLAIAKKLSYGQLLDARGYLKGKLAISGTMDAPVLNGNLHFDSAMIRPAISGEPLKLSNDPVEFDKDGFNVSHFAFQDSSGNKATIDGNVYTKNYRDYGFELSVYANDFRLVNTQPAVNRLFYGKLNLDAVVNLKGDLESPRVDGMLRVNKKTDFVFVLPGSNPEVVSREGVVRFVNGTEPLDSLQQQEKEFLAALSRKSDVKGMEVSLRISTDSSAKFAMIIDERSGDALAARGRSNLVFGMDRSGKMDLTGEYEVESGSYNLSLDVLKRKFNIQRGSTITWTGDPTSANVNITATYTVNTAPIDLVSNEISNRTPTEITKFKQQLPFLVTLRMEGELLKPKITFDINLPNNILSLWPDVDAKLQQVRVQESEMNKQVFALLLLNRFVGDDPLSSASGGGPDVGKLAFQSASQILTSQLDQLAASLIKGVDIHFDLNNQQDYSTGTEQDRTEMGVTVSKRFFNDRIQVRVGSNFEVQGTGNPNQQASNIAGDVAVDYKLTEDGRYMIRAYRKNQYEMAVEGQVVETGVSFILTFDYNRFREIFQKTRKPGSGNRKRDKQKGTENNPAGQQGGTENKTKDKENTKPVPEEGSQPGL